MKKIIALLICLFLTGCHTPSFKFYEIKGVEKINFHNKVMDVNYTNGSFQAICFDKCVWLENNESFSNYIILKSFYDDDNEKIVRVIEVYIAKPNPTTRELPKWK
jgi:hypothetical protein